MDNIQQQLFQKHFPKGIPLSLDSSVVSNYLESINFLNQNEQITEVSKAGEGNMNLTLRVNTSQRSFIVKQSRPWVEKYPQIEAPANRSAVEAAFYRSVSSTAVAKQMPKLLFNDANSAILIMEDLGELQNMEMLYKDSSNRATATIWKRLGKWLSQLHLIRVPDDQKAIFENIEMRQLNHAHIFEIPLAKNNGINLNTFSNGLAKAADFIFKDKLYRKRVAELGKLYLETGKTLLHGDYYLGSWLKSRNEDVFIIDPEFCFLGNPEFDLGVAKAHFELCGLPEAWKELHNAYVTEKDTSVNETLTYNFAGVEIMRRILGVAQLPLAYSTEMHKRLLETSVEWVKA